jgi:N-acylneuraminate cytidylyltransferase
MPIQRGIVVTPRPILTAIKAVVFDFDGVFTDDRVIVSDSGAESVICSRSDGLAIGMLKAAGYPMIIISKETNPVVSVRARKLSIDVIQGCDRKLPALVNWLSSQLIAAENCAFMGNDINDLECMLHVGLAVAPSDAHKSVLEIANLITTRRGGQGAIREFADSLLSLNAT